MLKDINRLNIAIILPTIISKNGTAKQSLELAKTLTSFGHEVSFFTYAYATNSSFPEFKEFKVFRCVDVEKSLFYRYNKNAAFLENFYLYSAFIFFFRFKRLFHNKKISVYNPHDWMSMWIASSLPSAVPLVVNINDVPQRETRFIDKLKLIIDRRCTQRISKIVVLDNSNKKKVVKWLNIKSEKVAVVRSGIDIDKYKNFNKKYDLRNELGLKKTDILFVCANLLAPNRRYEDVLHMLTRFQEKGTNLHLLILSKLDFSPSYAEFLKNIIKKNKLEKQVHFFDTFFSDEDRMMYIQNSDILIFPNSPQTWGLTVIEAMALGVPVIVSSGSGVSEVLHEGKDAFIYREKNVTELSKKIDVYLQNKKIFETVAKNGKVYVIDSFSWEKFGQHIEDIMLQSLEIKKASYAK